MTRHPRFHTRALGLAALAALGGLLGGALGSGRAAAQMAPAPPYYDAPCLDQNGDRIEDFLMATPEEKLDLFVEFAPAGWDPLAVSAQAKLILTAFNSSASVVHAGQWSPYLFVHDLEFGAPKSPPPELLEILALPGAIGARAYRRFTLNSTVISVGTTPRPIHPGEVPIHGGLGGGTLAAPAFGGLAPLAPAPGPAPTPVPPALLLYVVDSGINGGNSYWGIDAAHENPLAPKQAHDPGDISPIGHGTFVRQVAWTTLTKGVGGAAPLAATADVRVGVGPNAETTTLELTRGFDAIVAHIAWQGQQGIHFRPVINVSYDTGGPIANHDIIYPRPEGPLDPRAAATTLAPVDPAVPAGARRLAPASGGPPAVSPCDTPLFDHVYGLLGSAHDAVILVGAGNDGIDASFVINEVGLSGQTTLVISAVQPISGKPADYSCFGNAPSGQPQNGHPDLAALGRTGAAGFDYELEGTSIATAFASGLASAHLLLSPRLTSDQLEALLVNKGSALPDMGPRWYGKARITLPWEARTAGSPGPGAPAGPPTLVFPGSGERVAVSVAAPGPFAVRIFSVTGRLVRTLADGVIAPGRHELAFDGRADDGSPLPAGLYFVRAADSSGSTVTKRLIRR